MDICYPPRACSCPCMTVTLRKHQYIKQDVELDSIRLWPCLSLDVLLSETFIQKGVKNACKKNFTLLITSPKKQGGT